MPSAARSALLLAVLAFAASPALAQRTPRVASVQIMPSDAAVKVGDQAPFVATALDQGGNPIVDVTFHWTSSNSAIATIDQEGIATARAPGKATITVRVGTGSSAKSARAPLEVTGGAVTGSVASAPSPAAAANSTAAPVNIPPAPAVSVPLPRTLAPAPPVAAQAASAANAPARQPPAELVTLRYAPGSLRYRLQGTSREVRVDPAGASRTLDGTANVVIAFALTARGDSLLADLTIESAEITGTVSLGDDLLASRGRTFKAVFSNTGRCLSMTPPDTTNSAFMSVTFALRDLFTVLPAGPFAVGRTWSDTVQVSAPYMGGTFSDLSRRRHTIVGWDTRSGERALRVSEGWDDTRNGRTGRGTWGDPVDVSGSSHDTVDTWVSPSGVMLGATLSGDGEFTVTASGGRVVQRSRTLSSWIATRLKEAIAVRVTLAPGDASLRVGDRLPFLATAYDSAQSALRDAQFTWSSSNPAVVTVDAGGVAAGVGPGLAIVRVRAGTGANAPTADVPVQVTAAAPVPAAPAAAAPAPAAASGLGVAPAAPSPAATPGAPATAETNAHSCDAGIASACADLAVMYAQGRGVTRDLARARTFFQRACDGGNAPGCTDLGNMLRDGTGGSQDPTQARALFQRGCDGGNPAGCNNLGVMFEKGVGGPQDLGRARDLYQRMCDAGNLISCDNLGMFYAYGRGVPTDFARARALYQRACEGGALRGCTNLGVLYQNGWGVTRDQAQARTYFQRACSGGDSNGCQALQRMDGK